MVCYPRLLATEHRRVAVYVFRDFARGIGGNECLSPVEGSVGTLLKCPRRNQQDLRGIAAEHRAVPRIFCRGGGGGQTPYTPHKSLPYTDRVSS